MNMSNRFFLSALIFLLGSNFIQGQTEYRVALDKKLGLDAITNGIDIDILYEYIHEGKIYKNGKSHTIVAPKTTKKLAYGLADYRGDLQGIKHAFVYIIADYETDDPIFYFDNNLNFDFTDDGEPKSFEKDTVLGFFDGKLNAKFLEFKIKDQERILLKLESTNEEDYSGRVIKEENVKVVHSKFWFNELIPDLAKGFVEVNGISYEIQISDFDGNSKFGTRQDLLFTKIANDKIAQLNYWEYKKGLFRLGDKGFKIESINENATELIIKETDLSDIPKKVNVNDQIPDISLETLTDRIELLPLFKQKKYTFLDFWATWCKPCIAAFPEMKEIYEEYGDEFGIIGIADDKKSSVERFLTKNVMNWPLAFVTEDVQFQFNILALPTYYIVDSEGKVVATIASMKSLRSFLEENLSK
jgi:thiol-disulfide isomerase/thioredoxin